MNSDADLPLILAVDDDSVLRVHVSSSLKKYYRVYSVNSAKEALNFLKDNSVDLIILDVNMPEIDGLGMKKLLEQNEETKDIPVIFLTGVEDDDIISQIIKSGANDYLSKPISPAELLLHVRNQLNNRNK